jgi:hypothetical protein
VTSLGKMKATDFKVNPEEMQSVMEHQGIPKGKAAVVPVKGLRKRCKDGKLAREHHQRLKEGTRRCCGSRKRVTFAGKRTSRHATVSWRKRKLFRKSGTKENCGPCKELTAAAMRKRLECNNGIRSHHI